MPEIVGLTEDQIERAAREYCRLSGVDPDQMIGHDAEPGPDGFVPAVLLYSPLWRRVALKIVDQDRIERSIALARSDAP